MRTGTVLRRAWLVFCNESVLGVWRTKREARAAIKLRDSIMLLECEVVGPYVLRGDR